MARGKGEARTVRLGIIGAGLAVKLLHWPALTRLAEQFRIVAVADVAPQAAQEIAGMAGGCRWTRDYRELLAAEDVEAVLISLPIHLNAQVIIESVRAGKHVLCEKPVAANLPQGQEVVAAVRGAPVVVEIAENYHYRGDIVQARAWRDAGRIGKPFLISVTSYYYTDTGKGFGSTPWRHDSQYRGNAITDAGVHEIALLRELGGEVEQLQAFTKLVHPQMSGVDTMVLNLRFRNGILGNFTFSAGAVEAPSATTQATLFGTEGTIHLEDRGARLRRRGEPEEVYTPPEQDGGYYDEFLNFYEAIVAGKPVISTPEAAYRDLEIIMRGLDSAESRSVVLLS
jgi:predicted dehydrogenase